MNQTKAELLPFTILCLFLAGQAQAWSCLPLTGPLYLNSENPLTEEEILRLGSQRIANYVGNALRDGDFIVIGQFSQNAQTPFLHEEQFEGIRAMYWPPTENVQMPYLIEYSYPGAYGFEGHKVVDATLVPLSVDAIDARVSISAEYEGIVDQLPEMESDVIGVLRSENGGRRFELTASICPSYYEIGPAQVADLLECYRDGSCQ